MSMLAPILFSLSALATHPQYYGIAPSLAALLILGSCLFGDTFDYLTGKYLEYVIEKWPQKKNKEAKVKEAIQKGETIFKKYGPMAIVLMSCTPVLHSAVSMSAGATKYAYHKFIIINTMANIIIVCACLLLGHYFGNLPWVKSHLVIVTFLVMLAIMIPVLLLSKHLQKKA